MIVADVLGPWWSIGVKDEMGAHTEERRLPQFLHLLGDVPWADVTGQRSEAIPPAPALCVWRAWLTDEQLAALMADSAYEVLRSATVERQHVTPAEWPLLIASSERENTNDAFPPLPDTGWLEAGAIYQYGDGAVIVRQSHQRTIYPPEQTPALFNVWRPEVAGQEWIAGEKVSVGTRRTYEEVLYECLQAHVTQSDWTPPKTPALWRKVS